MEPQSNDIQLNENPTIKELFLADPVRRIVAFVLDGFIVAIPYSMLTTPLNFLKLDNSSTTYDSPFSAFFTPEALAVQFISGLIALILSIIYNIILPSKLYPGQTFGKKLLNIKVVKENGENVSLIDMTKRYSIYLVFSLLSLIPYVGLLLCAPLLIVVLINLIMLFTDKRHQTLYDKIANTVVIEEKK